MVSALHFEIMWIDCNAFCHLLGAPNDIDNDNDDDDDDNDLNRNIPQWKP